MRWLLVFSVAEAAQFALRQEPGEKVSETDEPGSALHVNGYAWTYNQHGKDWGGNCKPGDDQGVIDLPLAEEAKITTAKTLGLYYRYMKKPLRFTPDCDGRSFWYTFGTDDKLGGLGTGDEMVPAFGHDFLQTSEGAPVITFTPDDGEERPPPASDYNYPLYPALQHSHFGEGTQGVFVVRTRYSLRQMVVHAPGEHKWDGQQPDLELQLVHSGEDGSMAVASFGFRGTPGAPENRILKLMMLKDPEQDGRELDLAPLFQEANKQPGFPNVDTNFIMYEGTASVPPCKGKTTWFVREKLIDCSRAQLEKFKYRVKNPAGASTGNYREPNPIGNRELTRLVAHDANTRRTRAELANHLLPVKPIATAPAPEGSEVSAVPVSSARRKMDPPTPPSIVGDPLSPSNVLASAGALLVRNDPLKAVEENPRVKELKQAVANQEQENVDANTQKMAACTASRAAENAVGNVAGTTAEQAANTNANAQATECDEANELLKGKLLELQDLKRQLAETREQVQETVTKLSRQLKEGGFGDLPPSLPTEILPIKGSNDPFSPNNAESTSRATRDQPYIPRILAPMDLETPIFHVIGSFNGKDFDS